MSARKLLVPILLLLLLTGCTAPGQSIPTTAATSTTASPTDTPEPLTCDEVQGNCFLLVYNNAECNYMGPDILEKGPVTLLYINNSDGFSEVNLLRHKGNETIQYMADYIGEEPSHNHRPSWTAMLGPWEIVGPGKRYTSKHILEPGIHTMICADTRYGWWFGGGFLVEE